MRKIPKWLATALVPLVFLGGCSASLVPLWEWREREATHPVTKAERHILPVLALLHGKYVVTGQKGAEGAVVVTTVSRDDEEKINRALCDSAGYPGYYPWFRVLEESKGIVRVSVEAPTVEDSKRKGWYSLRNGAVIPERIVYYGPGFAFVVMPWAVGVGIIAVVLYITLVRILHKRTAAVSEATQNTVGSD